MRRILFISMVLMLCSVNSAGANLIVLTDGPYSVVHNDVSDTYWYRIMPHLKNKTYDEQIDFVNSLNASGSEYFGLDGWHMATNTEFLYDLAFTLTTSDRMNFEDKFVSTSTSFFSGMTIRIWNGRVDTPYMGHIYDTMHSTWSYNKSSNDLYVLGPN